MRDLLTDMAAFTAVVLIVSGVCMIAIAFEPTIPNHPTIVWASERN